MSEDEQQVYLAPSSASHSPDNSHKSEHYLTTPTKALEEVKDCSFGNQAHAALQKLNEMASNSGTPLTTAEGKQLTDS